MDSALNRSIPFLVYHRDLECRWEAGRRFKKKKPTRVTDPKGKGIKVDCSSSSPQQFLTPSSPFRESPHQTITMLFRVIVAVASVAFISQGAFAQLTIQQVVTNVNIVATVSGQTNDMISQISPSTPSPQVGTAAQVSRLHLTRVEYSPFLEQTLATNFNTIINSLMGDVTVMQATPPFTDCTATQAIVNALDNVGSNSHVLPLLH